MMLTTHNAVRKINGVGRLLVVLLEGCDLQASDANGKINSPQFLIWYNVRIYTQPIMPNIELTLN